MSRQPAMDPYTPRARPGPRKKPIGLSNKELTKVASTIASVRRNRMSTAQDTVEDDLDPVGARESSFIAEASFVRAPLNSRVAAGAYVTGNGQPSSHRRVTREREVPSPVSRPSSTKPHVSSAPTTTTNGKGKAKQDPLAAMPLEIQEAAILEDLLFVLMGIEGEYIKYHPDYSPEDDDPLRGIQFVVSPSLDTSLRDLVDRILPLGTYYTAIYAFVENRSHLDYGLVNHALCAAIRDMLKDYQTLLSQLEHAFTTSPAFSLQKLWFYVHPTIHTLSLIYHLIQELDDTGSSNSVLSDDDDTDEEERARNEALGLGGAALKGLVSDHQGELGAGDSSSSIPVKGGEVLTIIYERMQNMAGDPTAHTIYNTLLRAAGKPYIEMLRRWVTTGKLVDPYEEILVKENKHIDRGTLQSDYTDNYWERRYTLRDGTTSNGPKRLLAGIPSPRKAGGHLPGGACIPPLLDGWKHKILLAGKYLNVIRECGIETEKEDKGEDLFMDEESFYTFLEEAYSYANQTLLNLLLKDQQLIPRLRSLKRYFFLSQSSFLTQLFDLSGTELRKPSRSASIVKFQSILDLALSHDARGEDGLYKEDVKVQMADKDLYEDLLAVINVNGFMNVGNERGANADDAQPQSAVEAKKEKDGKEKVLTAIEVMQLDYIVKFPLSLVISRNAIWHNQRIFRFLLHLKHVEWLLSTMWSEQSTEVWRRRMPGHPEFEKWRLKIALLRSRMLAFVQHMLGFATFEVLEPNWRKLEAKLQSVGTVEQLLRHHGDFLETCLKECMLTSKNIVKAYSKMMWTCSTFASYSSQFTKSAITAIQAAEAGEDLGMDKKFDVLGKFEAHFNHWFQMHLDQVQYSASSENVALLPLVVRLNSVKNGTAGRLGNTRFMSFHPIYVLEGDTDAAEVLGLMETFIDDDVAAV